MDKWKYSGDVTPTEGSGDLIFGVHHALIYFPFYGYMDQIALYKRVLTKGEIEDLAEGNVTGGASVEVALETYCFWHTLQHHTNS